MNTICAIASGMGGTIGIIRISGIHAYQIGSTLTQKALPDRYANYTALYEGDTIIDKAIVIYFKAPHSFTGEDIVEVHCHGGDINTQAIFNVILSLGATIAEAGEFSKRAFLNGKIDLTEAEAIHDVIHSSSSSANTLAMRSLSGQFKTHINTLKEEIIHLRMFTEASIDFVDEEIDFIEENQTKDKITSIIKRIEHTIAACEGGKILRNGLNVAIIGKPNAGKSSLLNALTGEDTAIVTSTAGTTRDTITEYITINGIKINIVDTAGMRETSNEIESEGIKRAKEKAKDADIILLVYSCNETPDLSLLPINTEARVIMVANKLDIHSDTHSLKELTGEHVAISAKTGLNLENLKDLITKDSAQDLTENLFLARTRHITALHESLEHMSQARNQLHEMQFELLAEELTLAHKALGEITGEFTSDDLLGEIFSSFCIGK